MDSPFAPLRSTSGLIRRQVEAAQDETVQAFERLHTEWTEHHEEANYSPADTLRRMSEIFEEAYYNFLSEDPDPHDDRIPVRVNPGTSYSMAIKALCAKDTFLSQLCTSYTFHSNVDISTGATRLLLSVLPVIDTHSIIMDADEFCEKLYRIAEVGPSRELQSYAIGLIAACNEVTRGAHYSALNTRLIPVVLDRLKERQQTMRNEYVEEDRQKFANMPTSFAHLQREERKSREDRPSRHHKTDANGSRSQDTPKKISSSRRNTVSNAHDGVPSSAPPRKRAKMNGGATHSLEEHEKTPRRKKASKATADIEPVDNGWSNSSRTQLNKITYGRHSLFPLTTVMEQRLIMQYLTPLGEFQDLLTAIIENESIDLLLYYLDLNNTRDVRLTHEAIRFIASLLVHRKFAFAFIAKRGVERLMKVVKESMASVGVSTCLYYLSYSSDVMEAVCNLSDNTLDDIVGYALYLLDHSYESGRASAAMFFTYALPYRPIIERFDKKDGRLKMYNYISTLTLIQEGPSVVLSPDDIESTIQCLVNAFALLRSYVEAHLHFKLLHILNKNPQIQVPSIVRNLASNKSLKLEPEVLRQVVQVMLKIFSYKVGWKPIAELDRLGFIDLLSRVLNIIFDQSYTGRTEIVRYALEFVWIVTTFPSMRMRILQRIQFKSTLENSVFRLVMKICEGNEFPESAECLRLALFIISNLVGAPLNNHDTEARKGSPCSDVAELWDVFRSNEGLMMLIDRITKENTEHDVNDVFIREAACEALCGLARCESVRQVLSKLPIIAGDGLLVTCKKIYQAPIRPEQELFYKQAKNLVEKVIKVTIRDEDAKEFSQERIKRSTIIANTRYYFRDVEMLQLTCNYLNKLGLSSSATHLAAEARLNASRTLDFTPSAHRMLTDTPTRNHDFTQPRPLVHKRIKGREFEPKPVDRGQMIDRAKDLEKSITRVVNTPSTPALPVTPSTSRGSSHYRRQNTHVRCTDGKHENSDPLNDILSTYFKEKHSHCKHPVAICPPFSLFKEHKCSAIYTSRPRLDFSGRYIHRGIYPNYGNSRLHTADLYQIYSRFAQYKIFQNKEGAFTSCAFSSDDEHILLGTFEGELLWYNIVTEEVECRQQCHNGVPLNEIVSSKDGSLLLTATNAGLSTSILWNLGETPKLTARYNNASHACFSNTSTQYVMTTSYETATVHDLETESIVATFKETKNANLYQHNVATFDYKDTMVMNDGILYDFRASSSPIHKFDKLNSENGGVFHPDCLSVIVNTEVYDLRNYKLLHHVPALDNARITFNSRGNVLYAVSRDNTEDDEFTTVYKPLLVTLDTKNYEIIASNTLKRHLFDFAIDHSEGRVATVERSDAYVPENNMCRLFDIGKVRDDEEPRTFHDDDDQGDSSNSDDDDESRTSSNSDDDSDNLHDLFFPPSSGSERSGLSDDIGSFGESSDDGSDIGSDDDSVGSMDSELAEILDGAYGGEELYDDDDGEGEDESESEEDEEGEGEDEEDEEEEEDLPGTSSIVLNPRLRKERREQARRQEEEKQGGERSDSD